MRKPSIFSRDYEMKMRKRRKRIIVLSVMSFFLLGFTAATITAKSFDFTNIRTKMQMWIDNDKMVQSVNVEQEEETEKIEEVKVPERKTIDIKINEQKIMKVEYEESTSGIKFKEVKDVPTDIYYSINNNKNLIIIIDEKQNLKMFNVKGEEQNLTKVSYITKDGEVFSKDTIISLYPGYLWHNSARFLSDNKIAYISNVPYFGTDLNQYVWIVNVEDKATETLWSSKGKNIKFGEYKDKGLEVNIDGNIKYINSNGELVN